MGLVSLTFGEGRNSFSVAPQISIIQPMDGLRVDPNIENKLEVKKVCQFLGHDDLYIVGEVKSGVVGETMCSKIGDNTLEIVELECKFRGARKAKPGMMIGITCKGAPREAIDKGLVLEFQPKS
ncbi:MAG: hypothetical protein V1494_05090 [Candidatus Diapherotrites archaeon]